LSGEALIPTSKRITWSPGVSRLPEGPRPVQLHAQRVERAESSSTFELAGQSIYLLNQAEQLTGRGPSGNLLTPATR